MMSMDEVVIGVKIAGGCIAFLMYVVVGIAFFDEAGELRDNGWDLLIVPMWPVVVLLLALMSIGRRLAQLLDQ